MKILKIFGVVVGVHVFALILIFANPGCSSSTRPAPRPADTVAASEAPAAVTPPVVPPSAPMAEPAPAPTLAPAPAAALAAAPAESSATAPISFNPDLPAVAAPAVSRTSPTRPNTPVANALVADPVSDVTPAKTYTVMSGDNLWNLSKKHGVPVSQLAAANNLKASAVLHPGQKLVLPGKAPASAAPAPAPAAKPATAAKPAASTRTSDAAPRGSGGTRHVVKPGESLSVIAKQYGVGTGDLAVANNITDPRKVRSGMELVIPAAGGRGARPPAKAAEAPKPSEPAPVPTLNLGAPAPASDVPVIRVDENVLTPAPKP